MSLSRLGATTVWALELMYKEKLHPAMFHELQDGIVRLDPEFDGTPRFGAHAEVPEGRARARE